MVLSALLSASFVQHSFGKGVTQSQLSRLNPSLESTSVLLETSKELLKNDQLEDALPFLEEILVRLEGDDEKKARQTLAFSLYQLAHCQMKLGEYVSGAKNFVRFADEFPDDEQQESARVLAAQCLTMVQQWPMVEEQSALVLENPRLSDELEVPATQLLAESRYQQEKWSEATKPLISLFRIGKKDTVRAGAAVMLVTCYVRMDDFNNLFKFLPHCDEAARHDVGLNVALLEAGDSHYNRGEYQKALLLYRLVLLKKNLIEHYENRLRETKLTMKPFVAGGSQTLFEFKEQQRKQELLFERLKKQYQVITGFQDYDMDVALRTAQCYNDLERNWPAHAIYERIYTENPANALADQARFSAFAVMLDEREWAFATAEGYDYVNDCPAGEFLDDVTLNLMQVHMQQEQFDLAYDIGAKGLELSPDHKHIDQVKYLMGYIRFMQFDYETALANFQEILKRWPDSRYYESAEYWQSMSLLFLARFGESATAFSAYLTNPKYDPRTYEEDAAYRLGIAQYGAERYVESEETLRTFVDGYPESKLLSEAYAMLGDLRGAEGDMDAALDFYRLAREKALNQSQVDYPVFQAADVLTRLKRYPDVVALMAGYIKEWGRQGDFANAANWQGKAYKAMGEYPRALNTYFELVDRFGNDARLGGVDLILNEVIADYRSDEWSAYREIITDRLDEHLKAAAEGNQRTLELQYQTVFASILEGEERETFVNSVVQSKNVPASGANTLVLIAREGVKREDYGIVHEASQRFMSNFEVSSNMLYIMLANLDALVKEGSYDEAVELSEQILLGFGYSKSVGWARKRRGDVYRMQGKYDKALEAYKEVLSIREWRGELTPEALYCSGICKMELGETEEAFAYFQRIYVLYEDYLQWVAPAYAYSIQCLELLGGHEQDIINTYREMLANEAVAATPEGIEAGKKLEELEPTGDMP
ncbi:MAG: tetratricopeptide repeat protein [Verrucomicrobiota bacterium]|nr:tetratricopeptide repeat protein [Verrucomicrobiota bacterium]